MIWGNLIHLSYNMWADRKSSDWDLEYIASEPYLRFDDALWNEILLKMVDAGMNMVVLDLGDGVRYESHPEIAVECAWSVDRLRDEVARLRQMGLEPIPKLNFSTTHDAWLGQYSRCVSSDLYYAVCRDLISEVSELFGKPRFFHIGMDEETSEHQKHYLYAVVRQHELWWNDLLFYVNAVGKAGSRAWVWSDVMWNHRDDFLAKMPKSVLQSNWYYEPEFSEEIRYVKAYHDLAEHGYDQIPTGSNFGNPVNFENMISYFKQNIHSERILGFLQTPWKPKLAACTEHHMQAIEQAARAKILWESK